MKNREHELVIFVGKNLIDFFLIMFVKNEMKTAAIVEGENTCVNYMHLDSNINTTIFICIVQ